MSPKYTSTRQKYFPGLFLQFLQDHLVALAISEAHSEPNETSKMEHFEKIKG